MSCNSVVDKDFLFLFCYVDNFDYSIVIKMATPAHSKLGAH